MRDITHTPFSYMKIKWSKIDWRIIKRKVKKLQMRIAKSIKQRILFTKEFPHSIASENIQDIVSALIYKMERKVLDNKRGFGSFFKRIVEQF